MFSGIIEEVGRVASYDQETLVVEASAVLEDLRVSDSIMIAGCCLTVVDRNDASFSANTIPETVQRSSFGSLTPAAAFEGRYRSCTAASRIWRSTWNA